MKRLQPASHWLQPQGSVVWIGILRSNSFEVGLPWVRVAPQHTRISLRCSGSIKARDIGTGLHYLDVLLAITQALVSVGLYHHKPPFDP